jgi:class 3 adenylate cyclase
LTFKRKQTILNPDEMKQFTKFVLFFLISLSFSCKTFDKSRPFAKDGLLNLSQRDFEKEGKITLDGQWEFYWNHLYTPDDFYNDSLISSPVYIKVPGIWNKLVIDSRKIAGQGYGTYRLKVMLNRPYDMLGIKVADVSSAYKLWVNDALVLTNGAVSSSENEMEPQYLPLVKSFQADTSILNIVVQVSNNFHHEGGIRASITLGTSEQVVKVREQNIMYSLFLAGTLFILFIYHIWIYFLRRTEKTALWFGVLCFVILVRTLFINERIIYNLVPNFNVSIGYRIEYLDFFLIALFFALYLFNLFDRALPRIGLIVIGAIAIIESVIILFTRSTFFTSIVLVCSIIMFLEFVYFFILTIGQIAVRRKVALLLLFSWIMVLVCGINDILYVNYVINTSQVSQYAFILFLISQAYIISYRFGRDFRTIEDLSINLENKILERTHELEIEKRKADDLLLNILPAETANELKKYGRSNAKTYSQVTVMFIDIKDFTRISEKVSAELLVAEIDHCFSAFDQRVRKYGVEKIKTIGDSYMTAAGLPVLTYTHASDTVNAAFEIQDFMLRRKEEKDAKGQIAFEIRIGIHTGPVVAGIVGTNKFAYDIWGDTVNVAARMEGSGEAGKINISGATYELVKDKFNCTYRGKISAKNKGEIDMYFVDGLKTLTGL